MIKEREMTQTAPAAIFFELLCISKSDQSSGLSYLIKTEGIICLFSRLVCNIYLVIDVLYIIA